MTILFTSDLDKTLIFSKRRLLEGEDYKLIEEIEGRPISYMSEQTFNMLVKLNEQIVFIPVTTRSLEQYRRLTCFQQEILPQVEIVSNGGIVFNNGVRDENWDAHIAQQMKNLFVSLEMIPKFAFPVFNAPFVESIHLMDDLFYLLKVDEHAITAQVITELKKLLVQAEWTCHLQRNKLYILPKFLTKGAAVAYIKSTFIHSVHAAAGDSTMDLSMLKLADFMYIPAHAEIAELGDDDLNASFNESYSDFSNKLLSAIDAMVE